MTNPDDRLMTQCQRCERWLPVEDVPYRPMLDERLCDMCHQVRWQERESGSQPSHPDYRVRVHLCVDQDVIESLVSGPLHDMDRAMSTFDDAASMIVTVRQTKGGE